MQVSTALESDNYAIVGGGAAREFKISASSHAFKIMTDALYQDKPYAVARETICNATDAHIMGGCPERAVEISLSDTQFIVKDYGPGIADDNIQDTYCTLFGSTKTDDDRQTGGFGLGCKAPFSLTDHFMVISCHKGIKNTYAMTVGNDETDGKPAAQLMSTLKTTDTGLTVIIPIDPAQRHNFDRAIRRTVQDGGIKATLNGDDFREVRYYSGIEQAGFGLFPSSRWTSSRVAVLFGNVLYPMDEHEGTRDILRSLKTQLDRTGDQLVLYAPPSSVTPKPDRESLGYNDKTLATLNRVARRAHNQINEQMPGAIRALMIEAMHGVQRHNYSYLVWQHISSFIHIDRCEWIGAKAVARALAYDKFLCRAIDESKMHSIAADVYRDQRKDLLNCKGDLLRAHHRYLLRRLMRAVMPVVARPILRYRPAGNSSKLFVKIPNIPVRRELNHKPQLTLAPTSALMLESGRCEYVIITAALKSEEIAAIKINAERFGFDVKVLERPEKVVIRTKEKEVRVSHFFTPFTFGASLRQKARSGYRYLYALKDPELVKPDAFVAPAFERRKITVEPKNPPAGIGPMRPIVETMTTVLSQQSFNAFFDMVGRTAKNIAMPRDAAERDRLLAAGVPRFLDKLLADLKGRLDFTSQEHAFMATLSRRHGEGFQNSFRAQGQAAYFVGNIALLHRSIGSAVFMQPYTASKEFDEVYRLWCQVHRAFSIAPSDLLDEVEYVAWKRSKADYLALIEAFDVYLPQELRQFFARLRCGRIAAADVAHLEFLAAIISDTSQIRQLEGSNRSLFATLIRDETERFFARNDGFESISPPPTDDEEEDWT